MTQDVLKINETIINSCFIERGRYIGVFCWTTSTDPWISTPPLMKDLKETSVLMRST